MWSGREGNPVRLTSWRLLSHERADGHMLSLSVPLGFSCVFSASCGPKYRGPPGRAQTQDRGDLPPRSGSVPLRLMGRKTPGLCHTFSQDGHSCRQRRQGHTQVTTARTCHLPPGGALGAGAWPELLDPSPTSLQILSWGWGSGRGQGRTKALVTAAQEPQRTLEHRLQPPLLTQEGTQRGKGVQGHLQEPVRAL